MPLFAEDLRGDVTETSGHRMQLLLGGVEMLSTESSGDMSGVPNTEEPETNIPKSAITMSDSGSFVRYNMFSGL